MKATALFFLLFCALIGTANAGDSPVVLTPVEEFFQEFFQIVPAPKDEFETSEQYEARCAKSKWTEGLVYLRVEYSDTGSRVVYNADKQQLIITGGGLYSYVNPEITDIFHWDQPRMLNHDYITVLLDGRINVGTYLGQTAMGATAEITKRRSIIYWMQINNAKICAKQKLCKTPLAILSDRRTVKFQMEYAATPEEARQLKNGLCIVIGIVPDANTRNAYFAHTEVTHKPTITESFEETTTAYLIRADLKEVLLYNENPQVVIPLIAPPGVILKKVTLK